jgi:hypothetical protein
MISDNIILFIIIFVLSVAFSDTFFAEFMLCILSILLYYHAISLGTTIITPFDYFLGGYLFVLNAFYCIICMYLWNIEKKKQENV